MDNQKETFEQRLEQVKAITERIEGGQLSLEESVRQFEQGMKNLQMLENELAEMKRRITVLQQHPDGENREVPLEVDP